MKSDKVYVRAAQQAAKNARATLVCITDPLFLAQARITAGLVMSRISKDFSEYPEALAYIRKRIVEDFAVAGKTGVNYGTFHVINKTLQVPMNHDLWEQFYTAAICSTATGAEVNKYCMYYACSRRYVPNGINCSAVVSLYVDMPGEDMDLFRSLGKVHVSHSNYTSETLVCSR